jgi:hypothetical protein
MLNKFVVPLIAVSAAPVAAAPIAGTDAIVSALASSPGLLAAVVIVWLSGKERERAESARREHEAVIVKQREEHEDMMASRYKALVENNQEHMDLQAKALNKAIDTLAQVTDAVRDLEQVGRRKS